MERFVIIIYPNGAMEIRNKQDSLEFYQEIVEGPIEIVRCFDNNVMVINDEGKIRGLKRNVLATLYYNNPFDEIVGTVVIDKEDGPDLVGLTGTEAAMTAFGIATMFTTWDFLNGVGMEDDSLNGLEMEHEGQIS